ncbi:MAG: NAD(+)/NADH kinase [Bdellovibrionales bacterium]
MSRAKAELFRKSVKRVLLVYRPESTQALNVAREVSTWLNDRKIKVLSHPQQRINKTTAQVKSADIRRLDLVLVIGGDGTYLEAVRLLQDAPTPILGVNLGSLGFLTVVRAEDVYTALELALNGKMQLKPRSLIQVEVHRGGKKRAQFHALNDVVIERGAVSQLLNVAVYIERQLISPIKADGLIIATPTGSTAYNLAAGGPILHPDVAALVVTPICPHSLTHRPLIVPEGDAMMFKIVGKSQKAFLTVDGKRVSELKAQDELVVRRAGHNHLLLRKPTDNYFNLLRDKLKFGERA